MVSSQYRDIDFTLFTKLPQIKVAHRIPVSFWGTWIGSEQRISLATFNNLQARLLTWDPPLLSFCRDTAGQERYASLAPLYYRGASAAIIVYDTTSSESFAKAKNWTTELRKHADSSISKHLMWTLTQTDLEKQIWVEIPATACKIAKLVARHLLAKGSSLPAAFIAMTCSSPCNFRNTLALPSVVCGTMAALPMSLATYIKAQIKKRDWQHSLASSKLLLWKACCIKNCPLFLIHTERRWLLTHQKKHDISRINFSFARRFDSFKHLYVIAVMILVGNKTDLTEQREVSEEEGRNLADK